MTKTLTTMHKVLLASAIFAISASEALACCFKCC